MNTLYIIMLKVATHKETSDFGKTEVKGDNISSFSKMHLLYRRVSARERVRERRARAVKREEA